MLQLTYVKHLFGPQTKVQGIQITPSTPSPENKDSCDCLDQQRQIRIILKNNLIFIDLNISHSRKSRHVTTFPSLPPSKYAHQLDSLQSFRSYYNMNNEIGQGYRHCVPTRTR